MEVKNIKAKVGIFALSMLSLTTILVSPVMGSIIQAFPNEGISKVQMILSVANLTGLVGAFIVGRIALSVPKRTIALLGALTTCIAGLVPFFLHSNLSILIACSAVIGVSVGFITNVIPGLIAEYFPAEEQQGAMGKQVVFVTIGGMFIMFTAGALGANQWYYSYLTYLFAGVVFIVAAICLPKQNSVEQQEQQEKHAVSEVLTKNILIIALAGFFFLIVNNTFNNNISILITENKLGGSDVAGTVSMIAQVGGLVAGFFVGKIGKVIKTQMVTFTFIIAGTALFILSSATSVPVLILGSFLSGASQALFFSQAPFLIILSVPPILIPMGMAVLSSANAIGGFLTPFIINNLNRLFLGDSAKGAMIVGSAIAVICALFSALSNFQKKIISSSNRNEHQAIEKEVE